MFPAKLGSPVLIIGNSGAGKSTLGEAIAVHLDCERIDLDRIHWKDKTSSVKRNEDAARDMVRMSAAAPHWVIEAVYGWLAQEAVSRATTLIWLNLSWEECEAGLLARGPWPHAPDGAFKALLDWARDYYVRMSPSSRPAHQCIFEAFPGEKIEFQNRAHANTFIESLNESSPQ